MRVFSVCLFVLYIQFCYGYIFIDRSEFKIIKYETTNKSTECAGAVPTCGKYTGSLVQPALRDLFFSVHVNCGMSCLLDDVSIFPFGAMPYRVEFDEEEILCFIILRAPSTDSILMQVEQFGYSVNDANVTSNTIRSTDLNRLINVRDCPSYDYGDGVKITCSRYKGSETHEIISLQLLMDEYEDGKISVRIEDTINLSEGEELQLHCTGTGSLFNDLRQPQVILDFVNDVIVAENVTMEHSGTMLRCSESHPQSIDITAKFVIIVYKSKNV